MGYRKELPLEGVFALRFTWTEALDTAANVYHGVRALVVTVSIRELTACLVCVLDDPYESGSHCVV